MTETTREIDGMYQAILDNPNDSGLAMIYADALDDAGLQPEWAEFIRVQCELAENKCEFPKLSRCDHCESCKRCLFLIERQHNLFIAHATSWVRDLPGGKEGPSLHPYNTVKCGLGAIDFQFGYRFIEGFVRIIECSSSAWLCAHLQLAPQKNPSIRFAFVNQPLRNILTPLPIRKVHLTTVPDWRMWGTPRRMAGDAWFTFYEFPHWRGIQFRVSVEMARAS